MNKLYFLNKIKHYKHNYDYSLLPDKFLNRDKINIICPLHGVFKQNVAAHIRGQKCKKCFLESIKSKNFINKSKIIHNNKYDYSLVDYKNNKKKVDIICLRHGVFKQRPDQHIQGHGCSKCQYETLKQKFKYSKELFILKSSKIHDKYDYSLVNYKNNRTKVKIICPIHGVFEQTPYSHLKGLGCHICKKSKGEILVEKNLKNNNIKFISQKRFKKCKNKRELRYDFYLPLLNICIEYDGKQHFESIKYWGGLETLEKIKINDSIKSDFCNKNNIKLIRINYKENIKEKLKRILL